MTLEGVSKTAILTLRARADEQWRTDRLFVDPLAPQWLRKVGWPPELDLWYSPRVQSFLAFRADEIDRVLSRWLASHADSAVIELGCGLSTRWARFPAARAWIDLDLPEVIAAREQLGAGGPSHKHLALSVLDRAWLDEVPRGEVFVIAEGLFYYLPREEVDALFADMRARLPGATIAFDVLGAMDWDQISKRSQAVGAGVRWMVPDFEGALPAFGLSQVRGFEPRALLREAIARYWPRFGAVAHTAARVLSRVRPLAARRSGTLVGRFPG